MNGRMVSIVLDDGRTVDVFSSGKMQVYSVDKGLGTELQIPRGAETFYGGSVPFPVTMRIG